jgi:hypothetical protein
MHRFRIPEIFLGCFLTVAVFAAGMLFADRPNSSPSAQSQGTKAPEQPAENKGEPKASWQGFATDPIAALTLCLVFVGVAQAVLFYVQLKLIREALTPAKAAAQAAADAARIARNADRPYFSPFVPELRNWIEVIETDNVFQNLEVHLDITNIGRGVGFVDSYGIAHEFCRDGQQGGAAIAVRNELGRVPLRADSRWEAGAPFENIQIETTERLAALLEFRTTLFVYGYVRYYDLFGIFRKTGFMFQFIPDGDRPAESTFAMVPHAMWYDEEEPKTN